jgi:hypothetical protein
MYNKKLLLTTLKNLDKTKEPAKKKDVDYNSKMGYRDDSPFRKKKSMKINTSDGTIDMSNTGIPLMANGRALAPYSGVHQFDTNEVIETPLVEAKKGGSKLYSSNLQATNRIYAKNKLFKKNPLLKKNPLFKKKNYKKKIYDPQAMYFQDGGPYNTDGPIAQEEYIENYPVDSLPKIYGNEPDDYQKFLEYNKTAPENRRGYEEYVYGDPNSYDHYGMWDALGKPQNFEEALQMNPDWTPDEYDGMYHGFSVNPNTGVFLKSGKPGLKPGDTTWMEIAGHYLSPRAQVDTPVFDIDLQRFRYIPNEKSGGEIELEINEEDIDKYVKGGYIVEEVSDPSIPRLNRFVKGGPIEDCGEGFTYDPKLGCVPISDDSLTEDQKWMTNWYANRKIEVPENQPGLKKALERALPAYNPESPMIQQMQAFPLYKDMPQEYRESPGPGGFAAAGIYDTSGKHPVIYFNPDVSEEMKSDTERHELTNYFMEPVKEELYPMMSKIVEENIIPFDKKWPKEKQDFYDYVIDPNEQNIQSYLNVARKKFDLKPDEVITEEKLNEMRKKAEEAGMFNRDSENFNPDIYLLFHMAKDNTGLKKWFNLIAQNEDSKDMQYAKQGGSMGYNLGDQVDESTMRKLKRLGYKFEKVK